MAKAMIRDDKKKNDVISAAEYNRIAGVSKSLENVVAGRGITPLVSPVGLGLNLSQVAAFRMPAIPAWARNAGSNTLEPYRPAGVIDQVFNADANTDQQRTTRIVLNVKDPAEAESDNSFEFYAHQWVVCAERIGAGQVGLVWIRGACPAYLRIPDASDIPAYASLEWRENQLTASEGGTAKVIWNSGTSEDLSIVELGNASPDVPIPIRNLAPVVAPFGAIAEVVGADDDDTLRIVTPTGDDEENVLIVANFDIRASGYGFGWESEAHTILWNGAAPAVGDRLGSQTGSWYGAESSDGTFLIRAVRGGTALGFFTKAAAAPVGVGVSHYRFSYIRDDVPAANFGFPSDMEVQWSNASWQSKGFSEIDLAFAPLSGFFSYIMLDMITSGGGFVPLFVYFNGNDNDIVMRFRVYEVLDVGFDSSAVTWANHGALTTNLVADMEWNAARRISLTAANASPDFPWAIGSDTGDTPGFTLANAYGFMFEWVYVTGTKHANADVHNRFKATLGLADNYNRIVP